MRYGLFVTLLLMVFCFAPQNVDAKEKKVKKEKKKVDPEKIYKDECFDCHSIVKGEKIKREVEGPHLLGIFEKEAGSTAGFVYNKDFLIAAKKIGQWDEKNFSSFLKNPKKFFKKLGWKGKKKLHPSKIKKSKKRKALFDYISNFESK
ncbi:c-type cytochrome [Candidatus Riflebacteria bacterium]